MPTWHCPISSVRYMYMQIYEGNDVSAVYHDFDLYIMYFKCMMIYERRYIQLTVELHL